MTVTFAIDVLGCWPLASEAEVGNLETSLKVDEDVGRLEVEVDVPRLVDELEALSHD